MTASCDRVTNYTVEADTHSSLSNFFFRTLEMHVFKEMEKVERFKKGVDV